MSDKSVSSSFLDARDKRQDALAQTLSKAHATTLFLSLNIPGVEKSPPGSEAIFFWMLDELAVTFPGGATTGINWDALGPYAIMSLSGEPVEVKKRCINLESSHPAARLIDLDVYSGAGTQIDRASLGFPGRPCLVCKQSAVECIRVKRHSLAEVVGKAHELLAHFRT